MVDKKGYLRTLEVSFAILLTISVLVFVFSRPQLATQEDIPQPNVLSNLEFNSEFRGCVLQNNESCTTSFINNSLPALYRGSFIVAVDEDVNFIPTDLPEKRIHTDSLILSGNIENYSPAVVKLFYWVD